MLKQRLMTGAILAPLVILAILYLPTFWIALVFAAVVLIGAWEWARLQNYTTAVARGSYVALIGGFLVLAYSTYFGDLQSLLPVILVAAALWWFISFYLIAAYRGQSSISSRQRITGMGIGILVLVPTWLGLVYIHAVDQQGPQLLLYLMLLIWTADSGAYFAGRKWGKRKLAPFVSPGKSIEGVIGGLLACTILVFIAAYLLGFGMETLAWFLPLSLLVVIVSVIGDLAESLFKRRVGVKDSGTILPGHGGILDRIDSITAAGPVFALGLYLFGGQ